MIQQHGICGRRHNDNIESGIAFHQDMTRFHCQACTCSVHLVQVVLRILVKRNTQEMNYHITIVVIAMAMTMTLPTIIFD